MVGPLLPWGAAWTRQVPQVLATGAVLLKLVAKDHENGRAPDRGPRAEAGGGAAEWLDRGKEARAHGSSPTHRTLSPPP